MAPTPTPTATTASETGGDTDSTSSPQASTISSQTFAERFFSNIFARITAWLVDAANGVGEVFARAFHAKEEICVDDQCLTKEDVRVLLALAHAQTAGAAAAADSGGNTSSESSVNSQLPAPSAEPLSGSSVNSDSEAPVITLNGLNPATITVGDTFGDLGAIITGPTEGDKNLGLRVFVDGRELQPVETAQIDTSVAGEHTIDYVAQNSFGTATSTRTVIVEAPQSLVVVDTASTTPATP